MKTERDIQDKMDKIKHSIYFTLRTVPEGYLQFKQLCLALKDRIVEYLATWFANGENDG